MPISKYSCLFFSEGGRDKKFLIALIELDKFRYHIKKWEPNYDSYHGCSPEDILKACRNSTQNISYDLVLCFIDLDQLKHNYPKKWEEKKKELEEEYSGFVVIWQVNNAEEEYKRVLGTHYNKKDKLNTEARKKIKEFINSDFWKRILDPIKQKESELYKLIEKS